MRRYLIPAIQDPLHLNGRTLVALVVAAGLAVLPGCSKKIKDGTMGPEETWVMDTPRLKIMEGPTILQTTSNSVTISWKTDKISNGNLKLGVRAGVYKHHAFDPMPDTVHSITIHDLPPSSVFHFKIESVSEETKASASKSGFVRTGNRADNEDPSLSFQLPQADELPFEFKATARDNTAVDRVEMYIDGKHFQTDYSPPFDFFLYPAISNMTRERFFAEHEIEMRGIDVSGNTITESGNYIPVFICPSMQLSLICPVVPIVTNTGLAPEGSFVTITVESSETEWEYTEFEVFGEIFERKQGESVDSLQIRVNGSLVHTYVPEGTTDCRYQYDINFSGYAVGDHVIEVTAFSGRSCRKKEEAVFRIVSPRPRLSVTRRIERIGNFFEIRIDVDNISLEDSESIFVDRISSRTSMTGIQPISKLTTEYAFNASYSASRRQSGVTLFADYAELSAIRPGARKTFLYEAVPILHAEAIEEVLEADTFAITYQDVFGNLFNETFMLPVIDGDYFSDLINDAVSEADYLIVTTPRRLFDIGPSDASVNEVLHSMAELATLRNGVLGYSASPWHWPVYNQIQEWGRGLRGSDGARGGYLSNGYLLIVGEVEVVDSWELTIRSTEWWYRAEQTIRESDLPYADTNDDPEDPELRVGRIIGDNADELIIPLKTTINLLREEPGYEFGRSRAFVISGRGEGVAAFEENADDVAAILRREFDHVEIKKQRVVESRGEDIKAVFKDHVRNRDVVYYRDHGFHDRWGSVVEESDFYSTEPVTFERGKPFAFACCCQAGRYESVGATSIAEEFLKNETTLYIGSTENSDRQENNANCTWFYDHWVGETLPVGAVFTNLKRSLDDYHSLIWAAEYNLYGDPKFGGGSDRAAPVTYASEQRFQGSGPSDNLTVEIPQFTVNKIRNEDYIKIADGHWLLVEGHPVVPYYTVDFKYPAGKRIQNVVLKNRLEEYKIRGLQLPVAVEAWDNPDSVSEKMAPAGWWPQKTFDWKVQNDPVSGITTLTIRIFPFFYNPATTEARFFKKFEFEAPTITSEVNIAVKTNKKVYDPGDQMRADLWISNKGPQKDVIVVPQIETDFLGEFVKGLDIMELRGLQGLSSVTLNLDATDLAPGSYRLHTEILDIQGLVLDRDIKQFEIGRPVLEVDKLEIRAQETQMGKRENIVVRIGNKGSVAGSGTVVTQIKKAVGGPITEFEQEFGTVNPGESASMEFIWDTRPFQPGIYEVSSYVLYDSQASEFRKIAFELK